MKINFKELDEERKKKHEERLKFIELYVAWLKKTPNNIWSKHQKKLIDSSVKSLYNERKKEKRRKKKKKVK